MDQKACWKAFLRVTLAGLMTISTPTTSGLALVVLTLVPAALYADESVTITSSQDSYLREDTPTITTFGALGTMDVQSRNGARNRYSLVKFDMTTSGIPSTAAVKTSFLRLFMTVAPAQNRTQNAQRITGTTDWTESTVSWNNRTTGTPWAAPGGDFNAAAIASVLSGTTANVQLTWTILTDGTVTNIPQNWLLNPSQNQGVLIKDQTGNSASTQLAQFATKESGVPARFPMLEVHYLRDVTLNAATTGPSEAVWTWTFPTGSTSSNYDGVLFVKKGGTGSSFTFGPADATTYATGTNLGNGEAVVANTSAFTTVTFTDENGADSVVLPSTAYTYRAFNHDNTSISGAATVAPPHYATGTSASSTTTSGGGATKNWSYLTGAATLSPPALDPGNVVVSGSNDFRLHSMDAANGGRKYQPGGAVGVTGGVVQSRPVLIPASFSTSPCACDVAYATSGDGRVYAFNSATGAQLWQSAVLGNAIVGSPSVQLKAFSLPSYPHAFDLVIVGVRNTADTINNKIYGINSNTGAIVWTFAPGNLDIISSTPVLDYNTNSAWFTSRAGAAGTQPSLWKLDTATTNAAGNLLNSVTLTALAAGNRHIDASPDFDLTTTFLFAVTTGGDLLAVDHANPSNVFTTNVGGSGMGFPILRDGAALGDDDIYFSTSSGVHKRTFNTSSTTFSAGWDATAATLGGNASAPIFSPFPQTPFVYVGVSDGRLKKLSMVNGSITLTRDVRLGATIGDPSFDIINQRFYVGDSSGRIYSFDVF